MYRPHVSRERRGPRVNGSRGRFLLTCGVIYTLVGASFLPVQHGDIRARHLAWMEVLHVEPGILVGTVWLLCGLVMLVFAFFRRPRDRWGFAAGYSAPTLLVFVFGVGFVYSHNLEALLGGVVYGFFSAMSIIVSGMEGDEERTERLLEEAETASTDHPIPPPPSLPSWEEANRDT